MRFADQVFFFAEAAGDNDFAVLGDGFADGVEAFGFGAVEEAACVDDDEVSAFVGAAELVAFGAQARDDALAVDERFGAAERDDADGGGFFGH